MVGWLIVTFCCCCQKEKYIKKKKKRLVSAPGYLLGEEKHKKGSWPKRVITFFSLLLFPPLLCKLLS